MGITKFYIKHFQFFLGGLAAIASAIIALVKNVMVDLGVCHQGEITCVLVGSFALVLIMTAAAFVVFLSFCLFVDGVYILGRNIVWTVRWWVTPKPKVESSFELKENNLLELYIHNKKRKYRVEYHHKSFSDVRGRDYKYLHELNLVSPSRGSNPPVFSEIMNSNDMRKIDIGISHNGKIALRLSDAYVTGFRNGKYELVYSGIAWTTGENGITIMNERFKIPDIKVWLVIKDGVLEGIKKKL
jgi:hypothetical protein